MPTRITTDQLTIYLQDHAAGARFGLELARRARDANKGTELGEFLIGLADQIAEDRTALLGIMDDLGVGEDRLKNSAAWTGEKLGRAKLNGRLLKRAPLSTVLELEGLLAGVEGKLGLWRSLGEIAPTHAGLDEAEMDRLARRAQRQITGLRRHHKDAAREAFG